MGIKPIVLLLVLLLTATLTYYYFFVDTLSISQIAGRQNGAQETIILNLFDFDTTLTRYDIYRLSQKSDYWNMRMREVNSIADPTKRNIENENLLAEMLEDPALKKITRKVLGVGGKASLSILKTVLGIASF